jgi:dihydropteroate synthase
MTCYYRAIVQSDVHRPKDALVLAGGQYWFDRLEVLQRGEAPNLISAQAAPEDVLQRLTTPRAAIAGMDMTRCNIMGILNVTPDSFSDGGAFSAVDTAVAQAKKMIKDGAQVIDIGGESTRPGASFVSAEEEIARVVPVIKALRRDSDVAISIDTRKAEVARAAVAAGANLVNDVSAFQFDPAMAQTCAVEGVPVCLMHAQGDPKTMQENPRYEDVVLDVYDALEARAAEAVAAGISLDAILLDPGIGFGKKQRHNLAILRRLSLFHSLGFPVLLGASRKRFIGDISAEPIAQERIGGSLSVALHGVGQGVQVLRVHDTKETSHAVRLCENL